MPDALRELLIRVISLFKGMKEASRAPTAFEYAICAMLTASIDAFEPSRRVCKAGSLILSVEGL